MGTVHAVDYAVVLLSGMTYKCVIFDFGHKAATILDKSDTDFRINNKL
jgi:hypothetical protein